MTIDMSTICPHCGEEMEAATVARSEYATPRDGDASLCWACGEFGIFEDRAPGGIRLPTVREQRALGADEQVMALLAAWRDFKMAKQ